MGGASSDIYISIDARPLFRRCPGFPRQLKGYAMKDALKHLAYEIELQPGEKLSLPTALLDAVGAGRWVITVEPADMGAAIRNHRAFLAGYAAEDEGLYDD